MRFDRINQVVCICVSLSLRHTQDIVFVRVSDEVRVKRLAVAFNAVKSVQICFEEIRPRPHFSKNNKVIEFRHKLPNQIGFSRTARFIRGHGIDWKISHEVGVHPLIFQIL